LHGSAIGPDCEVAARVDRLAVQQDCAGTALATVTTNLCAGHAEVIAENFDKRPAIFDVDPARSAVHGYAYRCSWNGISRCDRYSILRFDSWRGCCNCEGRACSLQKSTP